MVTKSDKVAKDQVDDSDEEIFESVEDIYGTVATTFKTLKAWGGKKARIGSLTAGQMITFLENNDVPGKRRLNGLLLISQSLVDTKGRRLVDVKDPEAVQAAIEKFKNQDSLVNGQIVEAILALNGLNKKDAAAIAKNASGEVDIDASPSASRSN